MKLTDEQKYAIRKTEGNNLIYASFGAGKSSILTLRIAYLIGEGINPENILGLTFTNDAANNMKTKLSKIIGQSRTDKINLSTFHSFAYRTLKREYADKYNNLKIVEPWFQHQIASDIVKQPSNYNKDGHTLGVSAGTFLDFVSYQKYNMIRKGDNIIINKDTPYFSESDRDNIQSAFDLYCHRMKVAKRISFDDMLLDFYYMLLEDNSLVTKIKNQYHYILVDEGQDTSMINFQILKLIGNNNISIFQDVNQSIFSFQGARVENTFDFIDEFEDVEIITLPHNFRSTQNIIDVSIDLLNKYRGDNHDYNEYAHQISGRKIEGDQVDVTVYNNNFIEADSIADKIENLMNQNPDLTYKDFAVISRTNNGLLAFENELSSRDIPVIISSGRSFYDRSEIDNLLSYAKLYLDDTDDDSFRKIINRPNRYISNAIIRDLEEFAFNNNTSLESALRSGKFNAGKFTNSFNRLLYDLDDIRAYNKYRNAEQLLRFISKLINYEYYLEQQSMSYTEAMIKLEGVEHLLVTSRKFNDINQLFIYIQSIKDNQKSVDDGVVLTTAHSAKGLEWDTCFVVGVNDANYPHGMLLTEDKDEELRLLFVALGRAKNRLFISIPIYDGKHNNKKESRFLRPLFGSKLELAVSDVEGGSPSSNFRY